MEKVSESSLVDTFVIKMTASLAVVPPYLPGDEVRLSRSQCGAHRFDSSWTGVMKLLVLRGDTSKQRDPS